jgi:hypothetical protein
MTNGEKILFVSTFFLLGCLLSKNENNQTKRKNIVDPTISQYINRLKEFFNEDILDKVQEEFLSLVELGLSPSSAFDAVTEFGEIN